MNHIKLYNYILIDTFSIQPELRHFWAVNKVDYKLLKII